MANIFVRSTDGSDADSGATWALAKATLTGAAGIDVAGDTVWVSQNHAESSAVPITFLWAGTVAAPTRVLCGNDAAEPPTALATTGTVSTTGNNNISLNATGYAYVYGLTFTAGNGAGTSSIEVHAAGTSYSVYENCDFIIGSSGGGDVNITSQISASSYLINCDFKFANAAEGINAGGNGATSKITGGSILAGGTSPATLFSNFSLGTNVLMEGFDLSNGSSTMNIANTAVTNISCKLRNCKLPASWSGSINASTPGPGSVFELFNSDSADTNYRLEKKTQFGTVTHETTLVRTGGASDGTTTISWKMASNADAEWNHQTLDSPEIVRWNETVGAPITITVDILHDSVTNLTDKEIWLEAQYLGTSGFPLGSFVDDAAADYLASAADQTASSAAWTTTGMTNPNKQKLSVTFTPQEKGFIHGVVKMAKASYTAYVDPKITVT